MGAAGAGAAISGAGSLFGALGGNNQSSTDDVGAQNALLSSALTSGLNYSQAYTGQAVQAENNGLNSALSDLQQAGNTLANYGNQAANATTTAYNQSQALNEPMRTAGYNALDSYEDSLGVARPKVGNAAMAQALTNSANVQGQINSYQDQDATLNQYYVNGGNPYYSNTNNGQPTNLNAAPVAPTQQMLAAGVSPSQINAYYSANQMPVQNSNGQMMYDYTGVGAVDNSNLPSLYAPGAGDYTMQGGNTANSLNDWNPITSPSGSQPQPDYSGTTSQDIAAQLGQQNMSGAVGAYTNANQAYTTLGQDLTNFSPQQQALALAYSRGLFSTPTKSNLY